ncbi:hypothetical protein N1851_032503 [Merluccius polli]|uniref:Uncharacterized protein n=1 Tax=Merluccius polli TaxID=89951 RepID=A0AA47NPG6_MERPO|nr:hypothetical protein N1851_032503 [Merluccius polli]
MYLKDDSNVVLFPGSDGFFSSFDLSPRAHYEVFGEGTGATEASATSRPVVGPGRFSFQRPSAAAGTDHWSDIPLVRHPISPKMNH